MWAQALLTSPAGWVQNKILQINKPKKKKIMLIQNSSHDQVEFRHKNTTSPSIIPLLWSIQTTFSPRKKKSKFPINSDEKVKYERLKDTGHLTSCTKECTRRRFRLMLECHIELFRFHRETLWNSMLRNATMTMQIWRLRKIFFALPKL